MATTDVAGAPRRANPELLFGALRAVWNIGKVEYDEGSLARTVKLATKKRGLTFARDWTFAELLEWAAREYRFAPCLEYGPVTHSFNDMNCRANRVARRLLAAGLGDGAGTAIMMSNHPRFLDAFFAIQKVGGYVVPVNTALMGPGLSYVLGHSEVRAIVCDHETATKIASVRGELPNIEDIWVNTAEAPEGYVLPEGMHSFAELERGTVTDAENLGRTPPADAPSLLLYTSGTTGLPKAVVNLYGSQRVKSIGMLANLLYTRDDKLYTCLPLFHANALLLTVMQALWVGIPVHLAKRFSASRFWKDVAASGATQFNTVGGMIAILLKTPPSPSDSAHRVRRVVSAACPRNAWEPFEKRFGVKLWEGYGAVDGGGLTIFNSGNAPIGSLGRLPKVKKWKLIDDQGNSVAVGESGELVVYVGDRREARVPYWKNEAAANDKIKNGWLHTGDLMQADAKGFLYFVGRNTDSMRRRGENVSAYEVEKVVDSHPDVLESAAFGVPSPVGEQDIMISVVPVEGRSLSPAELLRFLEERLPKYAVPSYLDVVAELPKTGTHRVIKSELKKRGPTADTIRLEALK
jgi:crotonobetaine/carnitine-CoA ligase